MKTLLLSSLLLLAAGQPHEHTLEDLMRFKCENGNTGACEELKQIEHDREDAERLQQRVAEFGAELETKNLMLDDRRPDLRAAYPLVMNDYFTTLKETGEKPQIVSNAKLEHCASHYHDHWINRKLWWPNEDGKPNWEDIYVFIVDHYYGFCLKQP